MSLVIRLRSVTTVAGDSKVKLATLQRMAQNDSKKRQDTGTKRVRKQCKPTAHERPQNLTWANMHE